MKKKVTEQKRICRESNIMNAKYILSQDIVPRIISGEMFLIPVTANIVDLDDEFIAVNESAKTILNQLDGRRTVKQICAEIAKTIDGPHKRMEKDVVDFIKFATQRRIIKRAKKESRKDSAR